MVFRRLLSLISSLVVTFAGLSAAAEPAPEVAKEEAISAAAPLADELRVAWDRGDTSFNVIVHLHAPPAARLPMPERGVPFPEARKTAVRDTIRHSLTAVRKQLATDSMVVDEVYRLVAAFSARVDRSGLATLAARADVRWIEADAVLTLSMEESLLMIGAQGAYDLGYTGAGTAVAVIDTGIDYLHPSMGGAAFPNSKVVYGLDTGDNDSDPMDCGDSGDFNERFPHGTAVASVVAGIPYQWDSETRFFGGVAPDAKLLAYKTAADRECASFVVSNLAASIEDATLVRDTYNVVAINLSLGGGPYTNGPCDTRASMLAEAIDNATAAGIAVVASSGNSGYKDRIAMPACSSNAISVGAVSDTVDEEYGYTPGGVVDFSNSSSYLDLLAPGSMITCARAVAAGSGVISLEGTSFAAPMVAGAIALLAEANPDIDPVQARFALQLTGQPTTDPENGLVHPLLDLSAALAADGMALAADSNVAIPNGTGATAVSSAWVTKEGSVGEIMVRIRIHHPDPSHLVVVLVSPDGTRVTLHSHGEGNTPSSSSDAVAGTNGIFRFYPDQDQPTESLQAFFGTQVLGEWRLEVTDDDPVVSYSGFTPRIIGWALRFGPFGAPTPTNPESFFVPIGAHLIGAYDTIWVSDVRIFNPSDNPAEVELFLVPSEEDGTTTFRQAMLSIPGQSTASYPDVVGTSLDSRHSGGHLLFQTTAPGLLATSRTYNNADVGGTYGQFIAMVRTDDSIGAADPPLWLVQLAEGNGFRTNIGFSEVSGASVEVRVALYNGSDGTRIGADMNYTVLPFSNLQQNHIALATASGYATVDVVGGQGRVVAYASVVDNATGDAIYIPGTHPVVASQHILPIVAKTSGSVGTDWRTALAVLNTGSETARLLLEYRPEQGSTGQPRNVNLVVGSGRAFFASDLLAEVFRVTAASGSLRLVPQGADTQLVIGSRTYNQTPSGTYGAFLGPVNSGFGSGESALILHLDSTSEYRSNLGICEVGGGTSTVSFELKTGSGVSLGTGSMTVGPYEVSQINDVFDELGAADHANTRIELSHQSGDGEFTAYASVIDNLSGDAINIPAVTLNGFAGAVRY